MVRELLAQNRSVHSGSDHVWLIEQCSSKSCTRRAVLSCTGKSRGWGIVEYETPEEVCLHLLNTSDVLVTSCFFHDHHLIRFVRALCCTASQWATLSCLCSYHVKTHPDNSMGVHLVTSCAAALRYPGSLAHAQRNRFSETGQV